MTSGLTVESIGALLQAIGVANDRSRFALEQVLQAPWEAPDTWLSSPEGLNLISQYMPELSRSLQENPRIIYRVRMVENRNLIAIV